MGIRYDCYEAGKPDPYVNPDPRCQYPPTEYDPIDYCFGFATAVDAGTEKVFAENHCPGCDMWEKPVFDADTAGDIRAHEVMDEKGGG